MPFLSALRAQAKSACRRYAGRLRRHRRKRRRVRRYAEVLGVRSLLNEAARRSYREEIRSYWSDHFGHAVHPLWHLAFAKVTGLEDVRCIPEHEWVEEIAPFLNQMTLRDAFRDKNLSDLLLRFGKAPRTVLKRMHGRYYASGNAPCSFADAEALLVAEEINLIVKPSRTDDGFGVRSLDVKGNDLCLDGRPCALGGLEMHYGGDFIVQERIRQHPLMAEVHPHSVNTVRVVTFRWRDDIRVLLAFARFGSHGTITDNAGTGGLCCGIDETGRLNDSAVDWAGTVYARHPSTDYPFAKRMSIPNYDRVCQLALDLHQQIYHFDIVSWDIAIGVEGEPLFVEVNFCGVVHLYQFACRRPLFGELTTDVLEAVRDSRCRDG